VVDLYWRHTDLVDEFCVEVEDAVEGVRLILFPETGQEAVQLTEPASARPAPG
jgi:hypothetical protein